MIKLQPYYERNDRDKLLEQYLKIVADVVPFYRDDVLFGFQNNETDQPRARTKSYREFISSSGKTDGANQAEKKRIDAQLAEELIEQYSKPLHDYLYESSSNDGHVIKDNLRQLLTIVPIKEKIPPRFPNFRKLPHKDKESQLLLQHVFRYSAFSQHPQLYDFVQSISPNVCPYCNRQFTTTVTAKKHHTRPQLDHYMSKSHYPYLSLSINNLVPCCGVCNLLKHDEPKRMVIYPYEEEMGNDCSFATSIPKQHITEVLIGARIAPEKFDIVLNNKLGTSTIKGRHIQNSIDKFALTELYQSHKSYVSDLYFQRYILTDDFIHDLYNQFKDLFSSEEEIRAALLAVNIDYDHWGERPLTKLTHDIAEEIDEIFRY